MDQIEQMNRSRHDAHLDTPTFSQIAGRRTTAVATATKRPDPMTGSRNSPDRICQVQRTRGVSAFYPMFCFADATGEALSGLLRLATPAPTPSPITSVCSMRS